MAKFKHGEYIRHRITGKLFAIYHIDKDKDGTYYHCAPVVELPDQVKPYLSQIVHSLDMSKQYTHDHVAQVLYGTKT